VRVLELKQKGELKMKRVLVILAVLFVTLLLAGNTQAGTLDRGVHISSFFAGWTNGNSTISQLKYQMAIDSFLGFKKRYTTINYYYDHRAGTFNTFDVDVANSGDSTANVEINTWNDGLE